MRIAPCLLWVILFSINGFSTPISKGPFVLDFDETNRTLQIQIPMGLRKSEKCTDTLRGPIFTADELHMIPINQMTRENLAVELNILCHASLGILEDADRDDLTLLLGRWMFLQQRGMRNLTDIEISERNRIEDKDNKKIFFITLYY